MTAARNVRGAWHCDHGWAGFGNIPRAYMGHQVSASLAHMMTAPYKEEGHIDENRISC